MKEAQLAAKKQNREAERRGNNRVVSMSIVSAYLVSKIKKIDEAMKHVLSRMSNDIMWVPLYFETAENELRSLGED